MTHLPVPDHVPRIPVQGDASYTQLYKEPRQRNYRERSVKEAVTVRMPVLDTADAPLLLTGLNEDGRDDSYRVSYRRYGAQVYRERLHSSYEDTHFVSSTLSGSSLIRLQSEILLGMGHTARKAESAAVITQRLQEGLDKAGYVLIEGRVYEPCGEPVYVVDLSSRWVSVEHGRIDHQGRLWTASRCFEPRVFRADQLQEAKAEVGRLMDRPVDEVREPDAPYDQVQPALLRYPHLHTYEVEVKCEVRQRIRVQAAHMIDARQQAGQRFKDTYQPLNHGTLYPDIRDGEPVWQPDPAGRIDLHLPGGLNLAADETGLRVTLDTETADLKLDLPLLTRPAVAAAAALFVLAERHLPLSLESRLRPFAALAPAQAGQLATLLGSRGVSLAHRAARGQLDPASQERLLASIEHLLHPGEDAPTSQAAD